MKLLNGGSDTAELLALHLGVGRAPLNEAARRAKPHVCFSQWTSVASVYSPVKRKGKNGGRWGKAGGETGQSKAREVKNGDVLSRVGRDRERPRSGGERSGCHRQLRRGWGAAAVTSRESTTGREVRGGRQSGTLAGPLYFLATFELKRICEPSEGLMDLKISGGRSTDTSNRH